MEKKNFFKFNCETVVYGMMKNLFAAISTNKIHLTQLIGTFQ